MLIVDTEQGRIITAIEGCGDNLLPEDEAEGYKDYWLSSIYDIDGEELNLIDAGQILTSTLICDLTLEEQSERIMDYWEIDPATAKVVM